MHFLMANVYSSSLISFLFVAIAVYQQLQEYEFKIFGSVDGSNPNPPIFLPTATPLFNIGFPKINDPIPVPSFNTVNAPSIFERSHLTILPQEFVFGARPAPPKDISGSPLSATNPPSSNASDIQMDSSWFWHRSSFEPFFPFWKEANGQKFKSPDLDGLNCKVGVVTGQTFWFVRFGAVKASSL